MRIGVDFDNTIACYEGVFHAAALERGLIPASVATDKNAVRDHLNNSGRKDAFTELQGYVYGAGMHLVSPYDGVKDFVRDARAAGHDLFVVSHKTKKPMLGPEYDMHESARGFLRAQGFVGGGLFPEENIFFEETKDEKMARATALAVDAFIDDLPEILSHPGYPEGARAILFDPHGLFPDEARFERHPGWGSIRAALLG